MATFASRDQVSTPDGPGVVAHKEMKVDRGRRQWTGRYWVRLHRVLDTGRRQGHYWQRELTRNV